jgi:ATP-dependent Lon protease
MIILPKKNEKDLRDIPDEILKQIKLVTVENMDQVLEAALRRKPVPLSADPAKPAGGGKESESDAPESRVRPNFPPPVDQPPAMAGHR